MKLDALTPDELECYNEWNSADEHGGDCQTIGYSWAAWDSGYTYVGDPAELVFKDAVIIVEDDQGSVQTYTYGGTHEEHKAYEERVAGLTDADAAFYRQEQEGAIRAAAITDVYDTLQDAREELKDYQDAHNGRCHSCEAMMIQGVYCHETRCPANFKINRLRVQLERMENDY